MRWARHTKTANIISPYRKRFSKKRNRYFESRLFRIRLYPRGTICCLFIVLLLYLCMQLWLTNNP